MKPPGQARRIYFVTVQHLKAVFQILAFADLDQALTDPVDTFLQGIILHDTVFSFQLHRRLHGPISISCSLLINPASAGGVIPRLQQNTKTIAKIKRFIFSHPLF